MSLLKRLFGGGGPSPETKKALEYKGFLITPDPIAVDGQFRLAARIELEVDGQTRVHQMIRADILADRAAAETAALNKARMLIDQQGERLFG